MRVWIALAWLMLPVLVAAYHYGPGQEKVTLDEAGRHLRAADQAVGKQQWSEAVRQYTAAIEALPEERQHAVRGARIERAKAQLMGGELPAAHDEMVTLVDEMVEADDADPVQLREARATLAQSKYFVTWLMRLEGEPREVWEPEIESSRQMYRVLAEDARRAGESDRAADRSEDVEAAIRLARMDLSELQALALPSQCKGCCSGECKKCGNCNGRKKSKNKPNSDKKAKGASSGPPLDGEGS